MVPNDSSGEEMGEGGGTSATLLGEECFTLCHDISESVNNNKIVIQMGTFIFCI